MPTIVRVPVLPSMTDSDYSWNPEVYREGTEDTSHPRAFNAPFTDCTKESKDKARIAYMFDLLHLPVGQI